MAAQVSVDEYEAGHRSQQSLVTAEELLGPTFRLCVLLDPHFQGFRVKVMGDTIHRAVEPQGLDGRTGFS